MSSRSVIPRTRIRTLPASIRRVPLLAPSRVTFSIESSSRNFFRSLALSQGMSPFQKRGSSRLGVPPEANFTSRLKGAVLHSFISVAIVESCGGSPTVMEGIDSIGSIIEICDQSSARALPHGAAYRHCVTTQVLSGIASFPPAPRRAAPQAPLSLSAPPEHRPPRPLQQCRHNGEHSN